jgi:hypothetical protein
MADGQDIRPAETSQPVRKRAWMTRVFGKRYWEDTHFWEVATKHTALGCWEWQRMLTSEGYGQLRVDGKMRLAHRIVYQVFVGTVPDGLLVCHRCDNPSCVRPEHLFLGTRSDNAQDMAAKGRGRCGKFQRRLTAAQVLEIREKYRAGSHRTNELARAYGVDKKTIYNVVRGRSWRTLP